MKTGWNFSTLFFYAHLLFLAQIHSKGYNMYKYLKKKEKLRMSDNLNNKKMNENGAKRTIVQTAILMAILTLVSKLLGFVREMVIAGCFGTSYVVDAYVMAYSIPGILFGGIFASIGTAYMPTYSGIVEKKGKEAGNKFTNEILNFSLVIAIFAFAIGFLLSEKLVAIMASDFPEKTAELTVFYLRIAFGYTVFSCGASLLDAYMQYRGKYLQPIITGWFQNIGIIIVAAISAFTSHYYLAAGLLLGYGLRFLTIFLSARKCEYKYRPQIAFNEPVKQIIALAIPVFVGTYITQLNTFVDKTLASGLQEGSIAALNYGMMLVTLITGLTTTIIATIIYPKITRAVSNKDWEFFNGAVEKGLTLIVMIVAPFTLGAMAFSEEVVQIVYERGAFDEMATSLTGSAFFFYSAGLAFTALVAFLTQVYYSMRDMKTPIKCAATSVVINIVFNLLLVGTMQHNGLALATSVAAFVNFILMYAMLIKKHRQVKIFKYKKKQIKICISAVIAVMMAIIIYQIVIKTILLPKVIYLLCAVTIASASYILLLILFRVEEVGMLKELIKK